MKKWNFFKWTRDNQKAFADAMATELDSKASKDTVDDLRATAVSKTGDMMTGVLTIRLPPGSGGTVFPIQIQGQFNETGSIRSWGIGLTTFGMELYFRHMTTDIVGITSHGAFFPTVSVKNSSSLGTKINAWKRTYTTILNNGEDIAIPAKAGTMALVSDIEDILRQHGLIPPESTEQEEPS